MKLRRKYDTIIFLDVETSGNQFQHDKITELSLALVTVDGVNLVFDEYIQLPSNIEISHDVQILTGITREFLNEYGIPEKDAVSKFINILRVSGRILFVSHNAQFDMSFILEMLQCYGSFLPKVYGIIDTLTVFKDRAPYPHKLSDAIVHYQISNVTNSHRAIDDVVALCAVFYAMDEELDDLNEYVNLFGYNPKYQIFGLGIPDVIYCPQSYQTHMKLPDVAKILELI